MSEVIKGMLGFSVQIAEEYRAEKELAESKVKALEEKLRVATEALEFYAVHEMDCALALNVRHGCTCNGGHADEALEAIKKERI